MSRVVVGRIVKPFGVRGEVVVAPLGEDPGRFAPGSRLYVEAVGDEALEVRLSRLRTGSLTISFEGIDDRDQAEEMVGQHLWQDEERLPPLPEGAYYHFQLVGLSVVRDDGTALGEVIQVHELPAGDVLEVRGDHHEWMLPRHGEIQLVFDLAARRIVVTASDDFLEAVGQERAGRESPGKIRQRAREEARRKAQEAHQARLEEERKAEEKAAAEREAAELDPSTWNTRPRSGPDDASERKR